MTAPERIRADFYGTGLTIGSHPMRLYREALRARGVLAAAELKRVQARPNGASRRMRHLPPAARHRQRIHVPEPRRRNRHRQRHRRAGIFDAYREMLVPAPYLLVEGILQNQQGAISIKLRQAERMDFTATITPSHDFH